MIFSLFGSQRGGSVSVTVKRETRSRLRIALREEHERFTGTVNRSLIVLPSKVKAAVDHFNETLLGMSEPLEDRAARAAADRSQQAGENLAQAYQRAVNCIRYHLAIDSLTTGMLKEMGIGSESVALKNFRPDVNPLVPCGRSVH